MYILGTHIVATFSGKTYQEFVKERIFEPLNMNATTYYGDHAVAAGQLSQSWTDEGRRMPYYFSGESVSLFIAGAGGILSNTIDMVSFSFQSC